MKENPVITLVKFSGWTVNSFLGCNESFFAVFMKDILSNLDKSAICCVWHSIMANNYNDLQITHVLC